MCALNTIRGRTHRSIRWFLYPSFLHSLHALFTAPSSLSIFRARIELRHRAGRYRRVAVAVYVFSLSSSSSHSFHARASPHPSVGARYFFFAAYFASASVCRNTKNNDATRCCRYPHHYNIIVVEEDVGEDAV